jgi:adenylosuccinate synthase
MPVTVVVGGQFGSEGKGKVAHYLARKMNASVAIRCGGPNSGHTVIDPDGKPIIFQQLPTASILHDIKIVLCAGMYIDLDILFREIEIARLNSERLLIDPNAVIITPEIKEKERKHDLINNIGSTGSGTGAAVIQRIMRNNEIKFAHSTSEIASFLKDTKAYLRSQLNQEKDIILEGTQGFGLSLLHSPFYPFVTSRDTSAAAFLSEAGLSPLDVKDIILTLRAFPIRVNGNSGPLPEEINWEIVTNESGNMEHFCEYASVSKRIRRVARFDSMIVNRAIIANSPTKVVLNHLDYVDHRCKESSTPSVKVRAFIDMVESLIGMGIDYVGFNPVTIVDNTQNKAD